MLKELKRKKKYLFMRAHGTRRWLKLKVTNIFCCWGIFE